MNFKGESSYTDSKLDFCDDCNFYKNMWMYAYGMYNFICLCHFFFLIYLIYLISQFYKSCISLLVFRLLHDDSNERRSDIKYMHFC